MSTQKFKAEEVAEAIRKARGVKAAAARALNCSRGTIDNYIERYVTVAEAFAESNETNLDIAEGKLMQAVDTGNIKAIMFYLRTKGRDRGYGDRVQVDPDTQAQKIADQLAELRRGYQREYESALA